MSDNFRDCAIQALSEIEGYQVGEHPHADTVYAFPEGAQDRWTESYEINIPGDLSETGSIVGYGKNPDNPSLFKINGHGEVISIKGSPDEVIKKLQDRVRSCSMLMV